MEELINTRIESLRIALDNNVDILVDKINKFIRISAFNEVKAKKRALFKINDHKRNKKFKINFKKIGFLGL